MDQPLASPQWKFPNARFFYGCSTSSVNVDRRTTRVRPVHPQRAASKENTKATKTKEVKGKPLSEVNEPDPLGSVAEDDAKLDDSCKLYLDLVGGFGNMTVTENLEE